MRETLDTLHASRDALHEIRDARYEILKELIVVKKIPSNTSKLKTLRVLLIEDSEDDALLVLREMKKGGFNPVYERVETAAAMKKALKEEQWDIILSDYKLPKFDGIQAINVLNETQLDIPLLIVSGTIGEQAAVECMKAGALDYVMKNNLMRLCSAIERELKEALLRAKQRQTEESLFKSELLLSETQKIAGVGEWEYDVVKRRISWTDEVYRIYGVSKDFDPNNIKQNIQFYSPGDQKIIDTAFWQAVKKGVPYNLELKFINAQGRHLWVRTIGKAEKKRGKIVRVFGYIQDITERKKIEDEFLRKVEQVDALNKRLEFAMNATHTNTNIIDADFNLLYVDKQWQKIYGNPEGKKCYRYFMGTDKMCSDCAIPKALKTKNVVVSEEILVKENNRIVEVHTIPFQEADGAWKVFEFNIDITRRKQAEEKLKISEERLDRAMAVKNEGIWDWDLLTNETYFDDRYYTMAGYAPNEFPQNFTAWAQHVHPEDLPAANSAIQDYFSGKSESYDTEFHFRHKNGSWIWIRGQGKIVARDAKGKPLRMVGTHTDVTERKMLEENFRRSIDDSPLGVRISTKKAETIYANKAILDMYGYKSFEELKNTPVKDRYTPQSYSEYLLRSKERKQGKFGPSEYEISIVRKTGEIRHLRAFRKEILWNGEKQAQIIYMDITDRKQAQEKLQQTEEKYRLTFESTSDVIFTLDTQLKLTEITPSVEKVLGYSAKELTGKSLPSLNIMSPESREKASLNARKILSGKYSPPAVYEFILKDGRLGFGEITASPIIKDNKIIGVTCVSRDITERLKAEAEKQGALIALRQSEERYRTILDEMEEGYQETDIKGKMTFVNEAFLKICDFSREELIGTDYTKYTATEDWDRIYRAYNQIYETGLPVQSLEMDIFIKDGTKRTIELYASLLRDSNNRATGFRGIIRDITERKKTQEALRQSEEKYRNILENIEDGYYEVDLGGNLTFFNNSIHRISGYTKEELMGMNNRQYTAPESMKDILKTFNQVYTTGIPAKGFDWKIIRRNGEEGTFEASVSLLKDLSGNPTGFRGIVRDVTERKKAQEKLRQSEEKYRSLVENAQEGVYQTAPDGKFITVNNGFAKIYGYNSAQEVLQSITDISRQLYVHPQDRERLLKLVKKYGAVNDFEAQGYRKDGGRIWTSVSAHAVLDDQKRVLYYQGMIQDISEKKQIEAERLENVKTLRKALGATINAMAVTVETRDPYTAGHQRRVADLARAIATEMKLTSDQIDGVRMAGMIHDIGKISIPSEILTKPTQLSALEYNLIKTHPDSGYSILKDIEFPWPIARIVLEHHERINGSGYPRGLKENEILLESKIMAVADVVEAISSHRPYRAAHGIEAGLQEIANNRGVLYDAEAVDACLRLFREKSYTLAA